MSTGRQVIAFMVTKDNWQNYNWEALTVLVLYGGLDPAMLPVAAAHGVTVVLPAVPSPALLNASAADKKQWIDQQVQAVLSTNTSGLNVDFESPVAEGSADVTALTQLLADLGTAMRRAVIAAGRVPHYSIDVAWKTGGIDGRFYDYASLGAIFDYTVIMDYDTRSQVFTPGACLAGPNAPRETVLAGVASYLRLGVPAGKLVLGVPWYGYDYPCVNGSAATDAATGAVCEIARVEFRGCNCSDAAGTQPALHQLAEWRAGLDPTKRVATPQHVNATSLSLWWNYVDTTNNQTHQIWSDNADTLGAKWAMAAEFGLGGVSMWNVDNLYSTNAAVNAEMAAVWRQLQMYRQGVPLM